MKDLLFWCLMYLHPGFIYCCRCSFNNWCICAGLIFAVANTLLAADVSARPWYSFLQILFFRPMYLQLAFLWTCRCFSSCLSCTIASTSCFFWDLRMLPSQILHLHHTFSITWGYSPTKFCIFNLFFPWLADTPNQNFASSIHENPLSQISSLNILYVHSLHGLSRYMTYKKIDIRIRANMKWALETLRA